ncbi:hypothetical protein AB0C27_53885 [Nonomuraea sp. NPDC048882]|uniref:hypothetical protein n=1 Tax=Nonomuraea sp. NPDC048882 TaxID=3154347 RepID=UPI0033C9E459
MTQQQSASHRAFIHQLNELRDQAGKPPLSQLRKLSRKPLPNGREGRELAASTTQEVLSGKRRRLPPWSWVASYVAACHEAARDGSLDLGPMDMEIWRTRLLHARHGDRPVTASDDRAAVLPALAGPATMLSADRLTAEEITQCYLDVHGRIAARLTRMALNGDAEACFHLALFTLLRGWGHDGMGWLRRAVDAGHEAARALQDADDLRLQAADVAYQHGCALEAGGATRASIARCFYQLAAETGHPEAIAKITGMTAPPPEPPGTSPAASASDIAFTDHLPSALDDACAEHLSCRLGLPWQQAPHVIEPIPGQVSPASTPPASSALVHHPIAARARYGPAWQSMVDLAGAIRTAQAAKPQAGEEKETGAASDDATSSGEDAPALLLEIEQPPFPIWPDDPLLHTRGDDCPR